MKENLIIIGICALVGIALAYYFYTKISAQQKIINDVMEKTKRIETILTRPHPQEELKSVLKRNVIQSDQNDDCSTCLLNPLRLDDITDSFQRDFEYNRATITTLEDENPVNDQTTNGYNEVTSNE
jgi:hypothetical protein